jgi:hypothetical protein
MATVRSNDWLGANLFSSLAKSFQIDPNDKNTHASHLCDLSGLKSRIDGGNRQTQLKTQRATSQR